METERGELTERRGGEESDRQGARRGRDTVEVGWGCPRTARGAGDAAQHPMFPAYPATPRPSSLLLPLDNRVGTNSANLRQGTVGRLRVLESG